MKAAQQLLSWNKKIKWREKTLTLSNSREGITVLTKMISILFIMPERYFLFEFWLVWLSLTRFYSVYSHPHLHPVQFHSLAESSCLPVHFSACCLLSFSWPSQPADNNKKSNMSSLGSSDRLTSAVVSDCCSPDMGYIHSSWSWSEV